MLGYVDVAAGRQGIPGISDVAGGCAVMNGRAILDAIDACDRVVAYCDEALDRFRGRKAQGQLTLRTVPDLPPADMREALAKLRRRLAARGFSQWLRCGCVWQRSKPGYRRFIAR
jgi:hypothetical protein